LLIKGSCYGEIKRETANLYQRLIRIGGFGSSGAMVSVAGTPTVRRASLPEAHLPVSS